MVSKRLFKWLGLVFDPADVGYFALLVVVGVLGVLTICFSSSSPTINLFLSSSELTTQHLLEILNTNKAFLFSISRSKDSGLVAGLWDSFLPFSYMCAMVCTCFMALLYTFRLIERVLGFDDPRLSFWGFLVNGLVSLSTTVFVVILPLLFTGHYPAPFTVTHLVVNVTDIPVTFHLALGQSDFDRVSKTGVTVKEDTNFVKRGTFIVDKGEELKIGVKGSSKPKGVNLYLTYEDCERYLTERELTKRFMGTDIELVYAEPFHLEKSSGDKIEVSEPSGSSGLSPVTLFSTSGQKGIEIGYRIKSQPSNKALYVGCVVTTSGEEVFSPYLADSLKEGSSK